MLDKREVGSFTPRPLYLSPEIAHKKCRCRSPTEFGHDGTHTVLLPGIEPRLSGGAAHILVNTLAVILAPCATSICRQQET
jgi:hypothetical protein